MYLKKNQPPVNLAERLRLARAIFGVSQEALAVCLGFTQERLSQIERYGASPELAGRILIAIIDLAGGDRAEPAEGAAA